MSARAARTATYRLLAVLLVAAVVACGSVGAVGAAPGDTLPTVGTVVAGVHVTKPMGVLVTPGAVWAAAHRSGFVYRINPAANKVAAKIKVVGASGGGPAQIIYTHRRVIDVNYLYKSIAFINPATNKATVTNLRFENAGSPVLAGGSLWVLGLSSSLAQNPDRLSRVDPKTGRVKATEALANADGLVYGAGSLWASSNGRIVRLDPASGKTVGTFPVHAQPFALADGSLWALENDTINDKATLVRIDPATGSVVASVDLPDLALTAAAAPDGTVWVGEDSGLPHPHLWKVDPATNTVAGQVDLGNITSGVEDITVAPDGTVWASLFDADLVLRIKPT
jgi:streptogramin lyase